MTRNTDTPLRTATVTPSDTPPTSRRTLRTPALVAGIGTLLLAVLSAWANFGVVEALVTEGNAARTARDILAAGATFRLGIISLLAAAMLDVVVAWALWAFFAPVHRRVAMLAAWLRTVYAGIFGLAITQLAGALDVLENAEVSTGLSTRVEAEAMRRIESFHLVWDAGLVLFGLHLLVVGYLAFRSNDTPRLLGFLVAVAGLGYVIDSLGALLAPGSLPEFAVFTFVGEVLLLVWLIARGRKVTPDDSGRAS